MREKSAEIIKKYYTAFNEADMPTFFSLLDENIIHDINQGARESGKQKFQTFMQHMNQCYREHISDLIIMTNADGTRVAAEFIVTGTYIATDPGFLPATQQQYKLPAGAFFAIHADKITRVTNYYNVKEWLKLVS